jgi:hypothetical protein
MPVYGVTSKTRYQYERLPDPGFVFNAASPQAQGLVAWYPCWDQTANLIRNHIPQVRGNALGHLTVTGTHGRFPTLHGGVGYSNTGSTSNYCVGTNVIASADPIFLGTWVIPFNITATMSLVNLSNDSGGNGYRSLAIDGNNEYSADNSVVADSSGPTSSQARGTADYVANVPNFVAGAFFSSSARSCYLPRADGLNAVDRTGAATTAPTGYTRTTIGALRTTTTTFGPLNGVQWHVVIGNVIPQPGVIYSYWHPNTRYDLCYYLGRRVYGFAEAAAPPGGRTTKNTRAWPLGMEIGMNWVSGAQV